jgi:hypothetical protein
MAVNDSAQNKGAFWSTLPGLLTGLAALVAALVGAFQVYQSSTSAERHGSSAVAATSQVAASPGPTANSAEAASSSPGCRSGYFWRAARPNDHVCVTRETRDATAAENALADQSRSHDVGAAYGSATCKSGFVWREAYDGDVVCVVPDSRDRAHEDNRQAAVNATS